MSPMSKFKEHFFFNHRHPSSSRQHYDSHLAHSLQRYSIGSIDVDEHGCILAHEDLCCHPMEEEATVYLSPVSMRSSSSSFSSSSQCCSSPSSLPATTTTAPFSATSFKTRFRSFCNIDGAHKKPS